METGTGLRALQSSENKGWQLPLFVTRITGPELLEHHELHYSHLSFVCGHLKNSPPSDPVSSTSLKNNVEVPFMTQRHSKCSPSPTLLSTGCPTETPYH